MQPSPPALVSTRQTPKDALTARALNIVIVAVLGGFATTTIKMLLSGEQIRLSKSYFLSALESAIYWVLHLVLLELFWKYVAGRRSR